MKIFCKNCGAPMQSTHQFCAVCGKAQNSQQNQPSNFNAGPKAVETKLSTDEKAGKSLAELAYLLYALVFIFFLPILIGLIICYVKRDEYRDSFLKSHFDWLIQTFWAYFVGWGLACIALIFLSIVLLVKGSAMSIVVIFLAFLVSLASVAWLIFKLIKGWTLLSANKPITER